MLRHWLDDVGDGLFYEAFVATLATAAVALLVHAPGGPFHLAPAASSAVEEVRAITVAMLPVPAPVLASASHEATVEPAEVDAAPEPERTAPLELVGASDHAPPPPAAASRAVSGAPHPVASSKAAASAKTRRRVPCDETPDPGIVALGAGSWTIDRAVVKRYTRNWKRLDELGWSARHDGPDGKPDGMLIGGVRCGSDLHDAGIRAGDVVHTVNGRKVHSIPQAILVYTAVRNAPEIEVAVTTRKGERKTLRYRFTG